MGRDAGLGKRSGGLKGDPSPTRSDPGNEASLRAAADAALQAAIDAVEARMDTAEADIAALQTGQSSLEDRVALLEGQSPGTSPNVERVANMEVDGEFDYINVSSPSTATYDDTEAYLGSRSLRMYAAPGASPGGQRIVRANFFAPPGAVIETDPIISEHDEIWYSMALRIDSAGDHAYSQILRLTDNDTNPAAPQAGPTCALGLIYDDSEGLHLDLEPYGTSPSANPGERLYTQGFVALDEWIHLEIGAKIEANDVDGWIEFWLDGELVSGRIATKTILDAGSEYRRMQFGFGSFYTPTGSEEAIIHIDKCYLTDGRIGPSTTPPPPTPTEDGYRERVLALDPDGYWPLDNVDGGADLGSGADDATAEGGITIGAHVSSPIEDDTNSTDFDGTDDRLITGATPFTGPVTLFGWVYRDDTSSNDTIFGGNGANPPLFRINSNAGTNTVLWLAHDAGAAKTWTSAWNGLENEWHHFAVTFDPSGDEVALYIDGELVSEQADTDNFGTPGNLKWGAYGTAVHPFNGRLCHVGWKGEVMSPAEIAELARPTAI